MASTDATMDRVSEPEPVSGEFWIPAEPNRRVRGEFRTAFGDDPEVELTDGLVEDPRVKRWQGGAALSGSVADSVKAFLPTVLHGKLDDETAISVIGARNHGRDWPFGSPRYVGSAAIIGAHIDGEDQSYGAMRFRVGHAYWCGHLMAGESAVVEDDGSELCVDSDDDGNWLVYRPATPATLRQLEIRVIYGCTVLFELMLHREVSAREVQLQADGIGPWLEVQGEAFNAARHERNLRTLLPRESLTVSRIAKWIALNDKLDGLAAAAAHKSRGPLQEEVLVAASLVEGIHRRLDGYQQSRFPEADKPTLKRVARAARSGAGSQAESEGLDIQSGLLHE